MALRNYEASSGDSSCFLRVGGMLILRMRLKSLDAHRTFCGLSHHRMSGYGATRTFRNVRSPVAMGW